VTVARSAATLAKWAVPANKMVAAKAAIRQTMGVLRNADQAKKGRNRAYLGPFETAKAVLAVGERG
jgi:hypothetical protein